MRPRSETEQEPGGKNTDAEAIRECLFIYPRTICSGEPRATMGNLKIHHTLDLQPGKSYEGISIVECPSPHTSLTYVKLTGN